MSVTVRKDRVTVKKILAGAECVHVKQKQTGDKNESFNIFNTTCILTFWLYNGKEETRTGGKDCCSYGIYRSL